MEFDSACRGCFLLSVFSTFQVDSSPCFPGIPKLLNFSLGVYTFSLSVLLNLIPTCPFTGPRCQVSLAVTLACMPVVTPSRRLLLWLQVGGRNTPGPPSGQGCQGLHCLPRHTALGPWYWGQSVAVPVSNQPSRTSAGVGTAAHSCGNETRWARMGVGRTFSSTDSWCWGGAVGHLQQTSWAPQESLCHGFDGHLYWAY